MKLLNYTLLYLSGSLFFIIGIWAVVFYFSMLDEVYDSIDDGLDNNKMLIIQKAKSDSSVLKKTEFDESNYSTRQIPVDMALGRKERYSDTLMYMENEEDFEPVRLLTTVFRADNGNYYELKVISSMVEEDDLVKSLLYALAWLYAAIIISIVVVNNQLLKKIWQPFYTLILQLKKFDLRSGTAFAAPVTKVAEFKDLNTAVSLLLEENIKAYNSQKQFIENAAHELQTPLSISINKIELLLEQETLQEEQVKVLLDVTRNLERLTRLNKSLLLLSEIENRQFGDETAISLNELITTLSDDFSELLAYHNITLLLHEQGFFIHHFNKGLAAVLVSNILKNAIVHNSSGGEITISITSTRIEFSNTGGAEALDHTKIFRRFYKGTAKKESTGLGLSIVKAIASLYHLKISYSFNGRHHIILEK